MKLRVCSAVLVWSISGAHGAGQATAPEEPVVIEIGSRSVGLSEYQAWLARKFGQEKLQQFAQETCLHEKARRLGVAATRDDVEREIETRLEADIRHRHGGDRKRFLESEVTRRGLTLDAWKELQRDHVAYSLDLAAVAKATRGGPTDAEVKTLFEQTYGPGGRKLHLRHILITVDPVPVGVAPENRDATKAQREAAALQVAERVMKRLDAGEAFADVARDESHDAPSKAHGGRVAQYFPGRFGNEADGVIAKLEPGAYTRPQRTLRGLQIFLLERAEVTEFSSVEGDLKKRLEETRRTAEAMQRMVLDTYRELDPKLHWPPKK